MKSFALSRHSRRALLKASPAVALTILLAACSGTTVVTALSQVATDAELLTTALAPVVSSIGSLGLSAATVAKVQAAFAALQAGSKNFSTQTTPSTTDVQAVIAAVNIIAGTVLPLVGVSPAIVGVIEAAVQLLPALATAVGISLATAVKVHVAMTPAQARAVLKLGVGAK